MGLVVLLPGRVVRMATRVVVEGRQVEIHLVGGDILQLETDEPGKLAGPGALQRIDLRGVPLQRSQPRNRAPRR